MSVAAAIVVRWCGSGGVGAVTEEAGGRRADHVGFLKRRRSHESDFLPSSEAAFGAQSFLPPL